MFDEPYEDPGEVWGVGWIHGEGRRRPWALGHADVADESEVAAGHLTRLGVGEGDLVLLVFTLSDTVHGAPLELAAGRLGARYSCADATEGDAFRTASLIRQLQPRAVVGVNEAEIGRASCRERVLDHV